MPNKNRSVAILSKSFATASRAPIEYLESAGFVVRTYVPHDPANADEVAAAIGNADAAIVAAQDVVNATVFDTCENLSVVADHAIGCDRIDFAEAKERGIHIFTCPANHESVADLTWALILAVTRFLPSANGAVRDGKWNPTSFIGIEVSGKTLGLVGFGRIARGVACRSNGFGCKVLAYDPYIEDIVAAGSDVGVKADGVSLETLLESSDIVSVHVPHTPETQNIIGKDEIDTMKPGAVLINTARGGLVDETALHDAVSEGRIAGAGLDVLAEEPPKDNPLFALERVVVTPHMGAQTVDANRKTGMMAARGIVEFFDRLG